MKQWRNEMWRGRKNYRLEGIISFGYFISASKSHVLEVMGSPSSRHCESRLNDKKKGLSLLSIFHFVSSTSLPSPPPLHLADLTSMFYYGNWLTIKSIELNPFKVVQEGCTDVNADFCDPMLLSSISPSSFFSFLPLLSFPFLFLFPFFQSLQLTSPSKLRS